MNIICPKFSPHGVMQEWRSCITFIYQIYMWNKHEVIIIDFVMECHHENGSNGTFKIEYFHFQQWNLSMNGNKTLKHFGIKNAPMNCSYLNFSEFCGTDLCLANNNAMWLTKSIIYKRHFYDNVVLLLSHIRWFHSFKTFNQQKKRHRKKRQRIGALNFTCGSNSW